jgi:diadenosine tetraphosphate (Ap4A) HIT family hydrolase
VDQKLRPSSQYRRRCEAHQRRGALFAEAEGFEHIHFHVIPRRPDLDPAFFGPRVFGLLGGDPARHVPETVRDQIAANFAQALPARLLA